MSTLYLGESQAICFKKAPDTLSAAFLKDEWLEVHPFFSPFITVFSLATF